VLVVFGARFEAAVQDADEPVRELEKGTRIVTPVPVDDRVIMTAGSRPPPPTECWGSASTRPRANRR